MPPLIENYSSRKLYSNIFDLNQDGIPDLLTITEQEGIIQAAVEMNGYCAILLIKTESFFFNRIYVTQKTTKKG